ncbi:MAG: hypothetical protein P9X24_02465 [Candidatus Hatepunaea meridiana]|nr:hypothetical protein [Candidatus Hatepunaea meridiana]
MKLIKHLLLPLMVITIFIHTTNCLAQHNFRVDRAYAYAYLYWGGDEGGYSTDGYFWPEYGYEVGSDCANYTSQLMHAGYAGFCQENYWSPDFDGWPNDLDDEEEEAYWNEYGEDGNEEVTCTESDHNGGDGGNFVTWYAHQFKNWMLNVHNDQDPRDWTVHGPINDLADMAQVRTGWFCITHNADTDHWHTVMIKGGSGINATYTAHTSNRWEGQLSWYNNRVRYNIVYLFQNANVSPEHLNETSGR